jgi:hypothetical protein
MNKDEIIKEFQKEYGLDAAYYVDEHINMFFSDLFYEAENEEDLEALNEAEDYIRQLFNKQYN